LGSVVRGHYAVNTYYFYSENVMKVKMAKNFEDSKRIESNKPMESLQEYVDLCDAQRRAIENYARIVNKLKDELDKLKGTK
jgi:hypothetical protein